MEKSKKLVVKDQSKSVEGAQSIFFKTAGKSVTSLNSKTYKVMPIVTQTIDNSLPIIKLGMDFKNNEDKDLHRQIGISFNPNNSFAYDVGYDSESFNGGDTGVYWKFPNDDEKYVIAGVQEISNELEVPLEIVMGYDGDVTLVIDEWQAVNRDVYLVDKVSKTATKINENKATLSLTQNTYNDRFYLAFNNAAYLSTEDLNTQKLNVSYNEDSKSIEIKNLASLEIFEIDLFNILDNR